MKYIYDPFGLLINVQYLVYSDIPTINTFSIDFRYLLIFMLLNLNTLNLMVIHCCHLSITCNHVHNGLKLQVITEYRTLPINLRRSLLSWLNAPFN